MIVDASVALKWFIDEQDSDRARAWLGAPSLKAPSLLLTEVGNALWKKRRRGEISEELELSGYLPSLSQLISIVEDARIPVRALEIACLLDHPVYDCHYLALAQMLDDRVVTADKRLIASAQRVSAFSGLLKPL